MPETAYIPRYSIEDYLSWEGDWELWDGHAVARSPSPGYRHQQVAGRLFVQLQQALGREPGCGDCHAVYEIDWHVDDSTVVRPDILVLCGDPPLDFVKRPPVFVAEVLSPSTAEKDREHKRALYEAQGVKYYLLADPETREAELLVLNPDAVYSTAEDPTLALHDGCEIALDPSACFP